MGGNPKGKDSKGKEKDKDDKGWKDAIEFKTWTLKVPIHCPACAEKVKKVLQGTEGVFKTEVNSSSQKATVTGNVKAEVLIKELRRHGKHGEVLTEEPKKEKDGEKKEKDGHKKDKPKAKDKHVEEEEDDDDDFDDFHFWDDFDSGEESELPEHKPTKNVKKKNEGNSTQAGMVHLWPKNGGASLPMNYNNQPHLKPQPPPHPQPMYQPQTQPYYQFGYPPYYRPPSSFPQYGASYYNTVQPRPADTSYTHYSHRFDYGAMEDDYVIRCSIL